jgi:dihydropyrimidinase
MQNSCDLVIKNGSVVIPKVGIVNTNIMIENGKIKALSKSLNNISYSKSIDATGKYILPGLIDPHVHYGVYTPIEKAARTESRSAAIGGVTTMIRMLRLIRYKKESILYNIIKMAYYNITVNNQY